MKISKKLLGLVLSLGLVIGTSTTAFAAPADDLAASLRSAGVPESQIGKAVEYLQKVNITEAQAKQVQSNISSAADKFKQATVDKTVSYDKVKDQIHKEVNAAATTLGVKVEFKTSGSKGQTEVVVSDKDGANIAAMDVTTAVSSISKTNVASIEKAVASAQTFSNDPEKNVFKPVSGVSMNKTATNYGNMMVAGIGMVLASIAALVFGKKFARN
jgi:hypothetical protein